MLSIQQNSQGILGRTQTEETNQILDLTSTQKELDCHMENLN